MSAPSSPPNSDGTLAEAMRGRKRGLVPAEAARGLAARGRKTRPPGAADWDRVFLGYTGTSRVTEPKNKFQDHQQKFWSPLYNFQISYAKLFF
jgi:hypothetical protein